MTGSRPSTLGWAALILSTAVAACSHGDCSRWQLESDGAFDGKIVVASGSQLMAVFVAPKIRVTASDGEAHVVLDGPGNATVTIDVPMQMGTYRLDDLAARAELGDARGYLRGEIVVHEVGEDACGDPDWAASGLGCARLRADVTITSAYAKNDHLVDAGFEPPPHADVAGSARITYRQRATKIEAECGFSISGPIGGPG